MKKKILSQEALKLIACITMLIDHFGRAIVPNFQAPYMEELYYACRIIGRISFPIYCFLLVEGMNNTRNARKYIQRLSIGALLAELPFDLLISGQLTWSSQSVMITLTLGAIMLFCIQKTEKKWLKVLLIMPFALLAELTKSNFGSWGIAMIAVFAILNRISEQAIGLFLVNLLMNSPMFSFFGIILPLQWYAVPAIVPIALYSGKKLTHNRNIQWAFYLFYPAHLLLLWIVLKIIS